MSAPAIWTINPLPTNYKNAAHLTLRLRVSHSDTLLCYNKSAVACPLHIVKCGSSRKNSGLGYIEPTIVCFSVNVVRMGLKLAT